MSSSVACINFSSMTSYSSSSSSMSYHFLARLLCFLFVVVVLATSQGASAGKGDDHMRAMHERWMTRYGRVYKDSEEKEGRFGIFKSNVEMINKFNDGDEARSYKLGVNQFTDMTIYKEELFLAFGGNGSSRPRLAADQKPKRSISTSSSSSSSSLASNGDLQASFDWRDKGVVTSIKNQEYCGSCYAFAGAAQLESFLVMKGSVQVELHKDSATDQLKGLSEVELDLSEQQLMGCDTYNNGSVANLYRFLQDSGTGLVREQDYHPSTDGGCKVPGVEPIGYVTGYRTVSDENALLEALVAAGPISVTVRTSLSFMLYSGGVFDGLCQIGPDIAVLVIGYGTEIDGTSFWTVKNSWGTAWGEGGYMRLKRGVGQCGIARDAVYPIVSSTK